MRTTSKITNSNNLLYISRNFNALNKSITQLSNTQQVVELKDDPMSANIGIKMETLVNRSEQYTRNLKSGTAHLSLTDSRLQVGKTQMDKIKTIITGAANDPSSSAESRATSADELNQIFKTLVGIGNASDGSRYIFGGSKTTNEPFTIVNGRYVCYTGNEDRINIVVDQNTTMPINVTGSSIFGNTTSTVSSGDLNPGINMSTDYSTPLADLNGGSGVPTGKIVIKYDAFPKGLEVDLSGCDTLEDVKDAIEQQTLAASQSLNLKDHPWLEDIDNWEDLKTHYVQVSANPAGNGLSLAEHDENGKCENTATRLSVDDYASNKVAAGLGIKGTASTDPASSGYIHGKDLNPVLSEKTLLSDLDGYNDGVYTFTNGPKSSTVTVTEKPTNDVFNNWQLNGIAIGTNTGENGELYSRVVNRSDDPDNPDYFVEIYTKPIGKATASDLVATGAYDRSKGGLVTLSEANSSGISGTVGIVLPANQTESSVNMTVSFPDSLQGSVHVPAFVEEPNADGSSKDILNIASGWNIKGLDKPPAEDYNHNHPPSTDLEGNVSVNYRYDSESGFFLVELSRPAYGDQPAALIATGKMYIGEGLDENDALTQAVSGRVEFTAEPGFEGVSGSVFIELPAGTSFSSNDSVTGTSKADATSNTYALPSEGAAGTIIPGGALEVAKDTQLELTDSLVLTADTILKKGQVFNNDVKLPNGTILPAGEPLEEDTLFRRGTTFDADATTPLFIEEGTIFKPGQKLTVASIPEGTVIPRGSYYSDGPGFPADGMGLSHPSMPNGGAAYGHDVKATFATVEDLTRAIEELGIYVSANVSSNGKGLEFTSRLAGAWLTVSEDTDCYEQLGDINNQLTGLDLNGLVKGNNTDNYGNVYTEVIFYPPNEPNKYDANGNIIPVRLVGDDGSITEIEPGYYIRVYSDKDALDNNYETRDNSSMVAEGFVPAGDWNPDYPATSDDPFIPDAKQGQTTVGFQNGVVLKEKNGSGVNGMVNLDYYGGKPQYSESDDGKVNYDPYKNDNITVCPGGLRPVNGSYVNIQEADVYNITPGVGTDYKGQIHGTASKDANGDIGISFYKDVSHTDITGKSGPKGSWGWTPLNGDIADPDNQPTVYQVNIYSVDKNGKYLDKDGRVIEDPEDPANADRFVVVGTMVVDTEKLDAAENGTTDDFTLKTGGLRTSGQEREENVFATINDAIDALNRNDKEALHDLIGSAQNDIDRILEALAEAGALEEKMDLLIDRHEDDIIRYSDMFTKRVGMDDTALAKTVLSFQASMNAYQAAMQVSSSVMQMSLLNYI